MNAERLTVSSSTRVAVHVASHEAHQSGSPQIEPVHLFHAILNMVDGVVDPPHRTAIAVALDEEPTLAEDIRRLMGIVDQEELTRIRRAVQRSLPQKVAAGGERVLHRSPRCREVFEHAALRAVRDGSATVSLLHVVGALIEHPPGDIAPFLPSRDSQKPQLLWESRVSDFADELRLTRIALLMVEIDGSAAIQRRLGIYDSAKIFRAYDALLRDALLASCGREIRVAGDGFLSAFPDETEAVLFGLHVQAKLRLHEQLAAVPLHARMGIHVGTADHDADLRLAIDTVSAMTSLATGNQILIDRDAYEGAMLKLSESAPEGIGMIEGCSHGEYRVKGRTTPLDLCEIGVHGRAPFTAPAR